MNDTRQTTGGVSGDDIIYGNVTRGRQFRGMVNETDARAFRGNLDTPSDNLVRDFGPSVYQRNAAVDPFVAQRYYGDSRGVRPPEGFQQLVPGSPGTFQVTKPTSRTPGDLRMDATIPNPDMGVPQPSQYIAPSITLLNNEDLDPMRGITGIQQMDQELMPSRDLLRRLDLDETRIREMREELRRSAEPGARGGEQQAPANPDDVTRGPETPINDPLDSSVRSDVAAKPISGSLNTQQSLRQELVTATPSASRQSTQYAELQTRLERFRQRREMTDQEANAKFLQEWRAAQEAKQQEQEKQQQANTPQTPQSNEPQAKQTLPDAKEEENAPDDTTMRQRYALRSQQPQAETEGILPPQPDIPLKIASFAEGVKATGLKNLLTDAERAMQAGKFTQALDYYDGAAAVAPNNPLIMVGRSIAELGAGYYARAQTHLEQVLSTDPALLMARYDLKAFYGEAAAAVRRARPEGCGADRIEAVAAAVPAGVHRVQHGERAACGGLSQSGTAAGRLEGVLRQAPRILEASDGCAEGGRAGSGACARSRSGGEQMICVTARR